MLNEAVNPVGVGVKPVTTRPRVVIGLLAPVMVGLVALESVTVTVWLPGVFRVRPLVKVCTPLSWPAPEPVNV